MSIYDVVELARWKEDNMSCMFCKHYASIGVKCNKRIEVRNGSESFNCPHYTYNGRLKGGKQ